MFKNIVLPVIFFALVFGAGAATGSALEKPKDRVRNFESEEELYNWLGQVYVERHAEWNCTDYALWLANEALYDGFNLPTYDMAVSMYDNLFGTDIGTDIWHRINYTEIGGVTYLIEPQTKEVRALGDHDGL